jgi:hypothetical protein
MAELPEECHSENSEKSLAHQNLPSLEMQVFLGLFDSPEVPAREKNDPSLALRASVASGLNRTVGTELAGQEASGRI